MKLIRRINSSFRLKLMVMFILLTVIPLIVVGVVSYIKSYNIVSENSYALAQQKVDQLTREFDVIIQDIKLFNEIGKKESTVQFLIDSKNTANEAKDILTMINFYKENYQYSDSIMNIRIIDLEGKAISEDRGVYLLDKVSLNQLKNSNDLEDNMNTVIQPIYKNSTPALSMTSAIVSDDSKKVLGFITIIIKASTFKNILHETASKISGTIHIEDQDGNTLFVSPELASAPEVENRDFIEENRYGYLTERSKLIVFQTSDITGWKIVRVSQLSEIVKSTENIKSLIIITVGSSIIFIIGLYYFITSRLILPLRVLKKKMKQASLGDLNVMVTNHRTDEIADLGENFNSMMMKINTLVKKSVDEQKQLKIAELRTLQAQINPHFLYNTLETIIWMAEAKKGEQVVEITKALSHFFRISLSKGKDCILLEDEIEHIRNYLLIQKIRYQDILDVTFHLNEDILKYEIIKLSLQPLVENAIYHGIKNKRGKGFVRIKGDFNPEGHICIDVIDNGIGIKEDELMKIKKQMSQGVPFEKDRGGFGMVNVHQRLVLFYGEPFGLKINSWYGSGTRVRIIIPAKRC
ncbi:sensor histidine kinase [Metabacillus niabensis]|uniref:sensor histidine kinase n=1 Tax=Metabacillus niabensis TaxID=324854 RepID=UPI0039A32E62